MLNKKTKKLVIISVLILALIGASVKIVTLNINAERPVIEQYQMGEFVPLEDNYHDFSDENMQGYEIKVNSAEVLSYEEFLLKHNLKHEDIPVEEYSELPKYVYDLNITIKKTVVTDLDYEGISLASTRLYSNNDTFQISDELFGALYPHLYLSWGLKLRPSSEMQIHFPYVPLPINEPYYTIDSIKKTNFSLRICQYPVQKKILIFPDN